ncbi:MAG: sigma-70 family RNA polymerase sigma factor [Nannocystaceae bacterium]|nr:sigma-70 family RNA polymerase sigma factor [bacterium]
MAQETMTLASGFDDAWIGEIPDIPRLANALADVERRVREAWDGVPPHLGAFGAELARCLPADADPSNIVNLAVVDLHLAFAARQGHAGAMGRFESQVMATLNRVIGRVDASDAFIDEIKQRLRTKLFVSDGASPPKIAHYTGQGELLAWVRVVAVREALDSVRAERRRALDSDDALMAIEASATGPDMLAFRQQYKAKFSEAFRDALAALQPEQRNVLRLHYVHGLSIDKLGGALRVHRSSAARRIAKARQDLLSGTRRLLHARLSIDRREFDHLMGLVASRLDLSIERFLATKS